MRYKLFVFSVLFLVFSCTCSGNLSSIKSERKGYMKYITARSLLVKRDCEPTEAVNALGVAVSRVGSDLFDSGGSSAVLRSFLNESFIATAGHVVENPAPKYIECKIYVRYHDEWLDAAVEAYDAERDLAVLSVKKDLGVDTVIENTQYLGEAVYSAGYPASILDMEQHFSITEGVIATLNFIVDGECFHRITAQTYFGNSGGGVWSEDGKLVGITDALLAARPPQGPPLPYEGQYLIKPARDLNDVIFSNPSLWHRIHRTL